MNRGLSSSLLVSLARLSHGAKSTFQIGYCSRVYIIYCTAISEPGFKLFQWAVRPRTPSRILHAWPCSNHQKLLRQIEATARTNTIIQTIYVISGLKTTLYTGTACICISSNCLQINATKQGEWCLFLEISITLLGLQNLWYRNTNLIKCLIAIYHINYSLPELFVSRSTVVLLT